VGDSSDKNDKTQLLSDSQVLEVKPSPTKPPRTPVEDKPGARPARSAAEGGAKVEDKNDRSVWKGVVVGADDFAPPPQAKSSGPSWLVLAILVIGVLGAGGYLAWTKLRASAPAAADAAKAVAIDALPQDAAPVAVPSATIDAVSPDAAAVIDAGSETSDAGIDAGVDAGVKPIRRKYKPKRLQHKPH